MRKEEGKQVNEEEDALVRRDPGGLCGMWRRDRVDLLLRRSDGSSVVILITEN